MEDTIDRNEQIKKDLQTLASEKLAKRLQEEKVEVIGKIILRREQIEESRAEIATRFAKELAELSEIEDEVVQAKTVGKILELRSMLSGE